MGRGTGRIPNQEHWSCPDAESYITGIDFYDAPRSCRKRLMEMYPALSIGLPASDDPIPRPELDLQGKSSDPEKHTVRWGHSETGTWEHGEKYFKTPEDVFKFSPLEKADFRDWPVIMQFDYSSEEVLEEQFRARLPEHLREATEPEPGVPSSAGFYNTMFMWPMLTFGWELFLQCCLDPRFERVMDEFAELNRRTFRALAKLPVNFIWSHDDIVTTRGPVCSPQWMHKYIFPRYEEFWGYCRDAGKEVTFIVDGCVDAYADDVMACGARGITSEPYTDYRAIAHKHDNPYVAGEGDNRIIKRGDPAEIRAMVERMVETAQASRGYMMCVGNHMPWDLPGESVKLYLDLCNELAYWRE
ncbi:MAG: uroporphyrinogen decarboxylase family protein [Planctomycetota bacterium]